VKPREPAITPREAEVLAAMAHGLRCAEIARVLSISQYTVRKHRANMMARLGLRNAPELVAFARVRGWLKPATAPPGAAAHGA
jgi:DNA-binding CsgD family transcriptional regulator